jgi:hypothetical protein
MPITLCNGCPEGLQGALCLRPLAVPRLGPVLCPAFPARVSGRWAGGGGEACAAGGASVMVLCYGVMASSSY